MENTVKKNYQRTVNGDSIDITYTGARFRNEFLVAGIFLGSVFLMTYLILSKSFFPNNPIWIITVIVALLLSLRFILYTKLNLKIIPQKGIHFYNHQVPFSDIAQIGIRPSKDNRSGKLIIQSRGTEVVVAEAKKSIVEALQIEIEQYSGIIWKKN